MSELLQFSLLDMTPYNRESWFNLVGEYNQNLWFIYPIAFVFSLYLLRLLYQSFRGSPHKPIQKILVLLSLAWFWTGAVFHYHYFSDLNWAAPWFGGAFIIQGILLLIAAFLLKTMTWVSFATLRAQIGILILLVGLLIFPLSLLLEGRSLLQTEWFPLLPTPVLLVSIALIILLDTRWRHALLIIPIVWAIISGAFASTLDLLELYFILAGIIFWLCHFFMKAERS